MTALRTTSGVTKSKWDHRQSSTCLLLMSPWVQTKRPLQQSSPPGKKGLHPCVKASSHGAHVRVLWLPSGSISTLDAQLSCFQEHITNSKERPILQAKKKRLKIGPKVTSSFSAQEKEAKAVRGVWFSLNVICECAAMQTTEPLGIQCSKR